MDNSMNEAGRLAVQREKLNGMTMTTAYTTK